MFKKSTLYFIKAAIKNPMQISTVFETSPWLRDMLLKELKVNEASSVIELGPGAGAITEALLQRMQKEAKYYGIELNQDLITMLKEAYPKAQFFEESAEYCEVLTKKNGLADCIVSSLPWTIFSHDVQEKIITSIFNSLKDGGKFATYVCINAEVYPAAKNLKKLIFEKFTHVEKSPIEWRNIPPAAVYTCTK